MTTRVYISASLDRRIEAQALALQCRRAGVEVASTWHAPAYVVPDTSMTHDQLAKAADRDLIDLESADVLLMLGDAPGTYSGAGGKFVELGFALCMEITVVIAAHRESVFAHLSEVVYCEDPEAAITYIASLRRDGRGKVKAA